MTGDARRPNTPGSPGSPWRTLRSRVAYRNPWITVTESQVTRPDGSPGIYGVVDPGDNVTVVPLADSAIWMVYDFLYPIQRYVWSLPTGVVDPGEEPLAAARRELREEAGMTADRWDLLGAFYLSPGILTQRTYLFLARDLTAGATQREGSEAAMRLSPFSLEEVYESTRDASEQNGANAVTALGLWLARAWLEREARPDS